ncbi:hypothetical protein ANO11243_034510 [Dothideomycetidae sp. 11243]|nr:hypothetical protein ANO11243_034510 [fungal sp. No.11243]
MPRDEDIRWSSWQVRRVRTGEGEWLKRKVGQTPDQVQCTERDGVLVIARLEPIQRTAGSESSAEREVKDLAKAIYNRGRTFSAPTLVRIPGTSRLGGSMPGYTDALRAPAPAAPAQSAGQCYIMYQGQRLLTTWDSSKQAYVAIAPSSSGHVSYGGRYTYQPQAGQPAGASQAAPYQFAASSAAIPGTQVYGPSYCSTGGYYIQDFAPRRGSKL